MAEKNFKDYILLYTKNFDYRLKFAFALSEANVQMIERIAEKYGLDNMSKPVRLPVRKNPLDFKNVQDAEVYIIDITTKYPASTEIFHQELRQALGVAEKLVVVRAKNDPYELEAERINEIKDEQEKDTYKVKLLNSENQESPNTEVADSLSGEKYNETLKDVLARYRKDEKERITKTVAKADKIEGDIFNTNISKKSSKSPFTDIKRNDGEIVKDK